MSSSSSGGVQQRAPPGSGEADTSPLIPLEYADAPNQRFYAVSLFALQQSYKLFQFLEGYLTASSTSTSTTRTSLLLKWACYDILTLYFILPRLRIPRLSFVETRIRLGLVATILLLNWICIGDWRFANALGLLSFFLPTSWRDYFDFDLAILEHRIRHYKLVNPAAHILGSVTIHILPHSTAKLILQETGTCYCVSSPPTNDDPRDPFPLFSQSRVATIPVLLNNTTPKYLQYSLQEFGEPFESRRTFNLTSKDLKQIATRKSQKRFARGALDYDTFDEELEEEEKFDFASGSGNTIGQRLIGYDGTTDSDSARGTSVDAPVFPGSARENAFLRHIQLEKTQAIWSFNVGRPGIIRIERIIDKSDADVRIPSPIGENARILIVPCPSASFHHTQEEKKQLLQRKKTLGTSSSGEGIVQDACQNDPEDGIQPISVDVYGFPPLKLSYSRSLGRGKRETHTIDGVAPDGAILASHSQKAAGGPSTKARKGSIDGDASSSQQLVLGHEAPHGPVLKPQILSVPLSMPLASVGLHQYRLEKVTDACGNSVDFAALRDRFGDGASPDYPEKSGKASSLIHSKSAGSSSQAVGATLQLAGSRRLSVHPRSRVSFYGCGTGAVGSVSTRRSSGGGTAGQPIKLLRGGTASLSLRAGSINGAIGQDTRDAMSDGPWNVKVSFEPDTPDVGDVASAGPVALRTGWTKDIKMQNEEDTLRVDQPGRYRILSVSGSHCGGEVYEPSECTVYTPPLPTADLSLEPITDSCAGEVGLKASFSLSGEPPYRVHYSIQHGSSRPIKKTKTVTLSREELELRPEATGEFTYQFISIDDANYKDIEIGRTVKQTVHPLAGVAFSNAGKGQKVWSCEGDEIQVPIELKGIAPWRVDYRIVGQKDAFHVEDISDTKHSLNVKIPPKIAKSGGQFTLSIERVVDGRGCSQPLAVDDLVVNVHRTQPTATLAVSKKVVIKEGESVQLPLRLTGEGPWTVTYRHDDHQPIKTTIRANNGQIPISKPGRYELLSVSDAHCPGTVLDASKSWEIEWITKPTLQLSPESGRLVKNGSLVRPPVCEGIDDTAGVVLSGQPPFFVTYDLIEDAQDGHKRKQAKDLQSIQKHAQFELSTTTPGHKIYDFTGVSDSNYAQLTKSGLVSPDQSNKAGRVRLEQDILARPSVMFVEQDKKPVFCVKDSLDSSHAHTPSLRLTGAAPFRVELEISPDGSQSSQRYSDILIKSNNWKLHLPQHVFAESGPYTVSLRKVVDTTGCERIIPRGTKGSFVRFEVADIASIAALQPQTDHCVGDSIDFVLQGSAPWTVQYSFEGKKQKVTAKESRFSRVAEQPGNFKILSVAHHQDSCKSVITDISKTIHPLPAAKVQSGNYYVENIREGDQAEIIFEFTGTPPFTFTYTKSAPLDPGHRKNQKPIILETHTITNVLTNKYSIFTQSEGTWNVVSVQDRYCAYPPLGIRSDRKMIQN